jgi:hypothetical protein
MAFEIVVKMLGDGSGFHRMLDQAKGKAGNFAGGLKGTLAGAFSVGAVVAAARQNLLYADSLEDMTKKLGVSTTKLQEWDHAAKMSGTTLDAFGQGVKGLSQALANPAGSKMDMFKMLGIDATTLKNSPIDKLMELVADAFKNLDFGAGELDIATALLGKGGMALLPAFKSGLADAGKEAQALGLVLGEDVVKALAEAQDSIEKMGTRMLLHL